MWRAAPAGIRRPADSPTARSDGPPVSSTRSVSMTPDDRLDRDDAATAAVGRLGAQAGERGPFAQLDARRLHRQRVGADVAWRIDVAVASR